MASVAYTYLEETAEEDDSHSIASTVDDIPDGGAQAWLQVAGSFCINLSTW